jgi:hypothetical protein
MDLYTAEKLILDRHLEQVNEGERLTRLLDRVEDRALRVWTAARLRALADRLDRTQRGVITLVR